MLFRSLLSMGFSRPEYWSGLPCPPPGDRPNPGIEPVSPATPALQVDSLPLSYQGSQTGSQTVSELVSYKPLRRCLQLFNSICDKNAVLKHIHKPERRSCRGPGHSAEMGRHGICTPASAWGCISAGALAVNLKSPGDKTCALPPQWPHQWPQ